MSRQDRLAIVLYLVATVALGFVDFRVRRFSDHVVTKYIPGVLDGTYGAPATYRVLAPFAIDAFNRLTGLPPLEGFLVTRLVAFYGALLAIHIYLRRWFDAAASTGGTLAVAALLPLTFTNSWAHPDSVVELALFTVGCGLVAGRRDDWLYPLLALATLNRETSAFLVLLWAVDRFHDRSWGHLLWRGASYAGLWAGIYFGLRWLRGYQHYQYWMLPQNLSVLTPLPQGFDPYTRIGGYLWLVLLGVPVALAIAGARAPGAPAWFTRTFVVAGLFVLTSLLMSAIMETRIFIPLVPLLAPSALAGFLAGDRARN